MISAVFECNVIISAIGWGGHPRSCLNLVAAGQVRLCWSAEIAAEFGVRVLEVLAAMKPQVNPRPMLDWLLTVAYFVDPAPLGKQRSRDLKHDRYLACALGARAEAMVTHDRDLLDLRKPFGVHIFTPVEFLKFVRGSSTFQT